MKKYFLILHICLILLCCKEAANHSGFKIDENIEAEVNSKISELEFGTSFNDFFLMYDNTLIGDFYKNNSLDFSTRSKEKKMPFKSFYYQRNDTISIDGAYGLFGGFGFSLKFVNNKPTLYHLLAADDFPMYSLTEKGDLKLRIEVPCSEATIILSKMPEMKENEIIYGVVEFKSDSYYEAISINKNGESSARNKHKMAMKIYFKSRYFDFDKPIDYQNKSLDILEE